MLVPIHVGVNAWTIAKADVVEEILGYKMREKHLTIVITEKCNLQCIYCYEKNRTPRKANFQDICNFICEEISSKANESYDAFLIEFFGGEPFLEFDLIKKVTDFVRTIKTDKKIHLFAVTNGTLVHGKIKEWLLNNLDIFTCGLSFDGDKYSQNINRSNSFELIDLDFFAKNYVGQWVKMTISRESLPFLFENIIYCHNKNIQVHANLAYGIDWSDLDNLKILAYQLDKLIDYYLENPKVEICSLLGGSIVINNIKKDSVRRWCGVTSGSMVVYSVDGKKYPCQLLLPLSSYTNEDSEMGIIPEEIPLKLLDEKCQNCCLVELCPLCSASNFVNNGSPYKKDKGFCEMQRIILRKKAIFNARRWEKGLVSLTKSAEKLFLQSILKILDETRDFESY